MSDKECFQMLFEGYELILVDDIPKDWSFENIKNSDSFEFRNKYANEPRMIPGRIYVFNKVNTIDDEDLALKIFPKRLLEIGADNINAPRSAKDLICLFMGGPLYTIEYFYHGHKGIIINRVYSSSKANENREELIMAFI